MNPKHILRFAEGCARDHVWDSYVPQFMCAVLVQRGVPVAVGFNSGKASLLQDQYKHSEHVVTIHAEVDAILKARRRKVEPSRCEMFVLRLMRMRDEHNRRMLGTAKPCSMCQTILYTHDIKKVWYTDGDNLVGKMKITI